VLTLVFVFVGHVFFELIFVVCCVWAIYALVVMFAIDVFCEFGPVWSDVCAVGAYVCLPEVVHEGLFV